MVRKRMRLWDFSQPSSGFFLAAAAVFFAIGMGSGFFLSGKEISFTENFSFFQGIDSVTPLRFWQVFWSQIRWTAAAALLSVSALGLFLLYPLVFLRGLFLGFSFAFCFGREGMNACLPHFLLSVFLACPGLLLLSACGMCRSVSEVRRTHTDGNFPGGVLALTALALLLTLLCVCAELWIVPGFAAYMQT